MPGPSKAYSPPPTNPIVGIDLGTTHSLVAFVRDGKAEILLSREGRRLIPSIVSFSGADADGTPSQPRVGYAAKEGKIRDAEHTVFSVKRLLGRGFADVLASEGVLPYRIEAPTGGAGEGAGAGEGLVRIRVGGSTYTAIEISAMILGEAKASAEAALGTSVTRAVITVPAYFNDSQRQATRAAGRLAGLDVLRIVNEPTAAALAYGLDRKREGLIAVYDLGGGTFDVSILKLQGGVFEVLATNGHTSLGGDDLDGVLADLAAREIAAKWSIDPRADRAMRASLIETAENAKIALSMGETATLSLAVRGETYVRTVTRAEFEALARPVLEATREPCLAALSDAGLQASELSDVVLVGGPTRLGIVQQVAREIFGREPNTSMHPDEVVAVGAAIQADILAGNNRELLLLDVVPLSLGIETYGGVMSTLIARNTTIPTVAREGFTTFVDRQTGVDIHVLQGERDRAEDNRSLARFKLKGIRPAPAGTPRIEVTFLIDADGILSVAAKDLHTGHEQAIEVKPSFGLTDDEVERMLAMSQSHADEDEEFRKLVEARTQAEPVLRSSEKRLEDAQRLLNADEVARITVAIGEVREALAGDDRQRILAATYRLSEATTRLADLVVKEALVRARAEGKEN